MSFPALIVLSFCWVGGLVLLTFGVRRLILVARFCRHSTRVLATRLPDHADRRAGGPDIVYRRQAEFYCPMLRQMRVVTERTGSDRQVPWEPDDAVPVLVSSLPPHQASIATFRNLFLFPMVFTAMGMFWTLVIPLAVIGHGA